MTQRHRPKSDNGNSGLIEPRQQPGCVGDVRGGDEGQRNSGSMPRTLNLGICSAGIIRGAMQSNGWPTPQAGVESAGP